MTKKETTAVALKLFAIYLLSQIFIILPSMGSLALKINNIGTSTQSNAWLYVVPVLSILFIIIIAALVWKFTNSLLTKETTPDESGDLGVNGVMKIILACMGVYFVVDAVIAFPYALVEFVHRSPQVTDSTVRTSMYLLTQILEFLFGSLLIAKPGKWVKAIRSIGEI